MHAFTDGLKFTTGGIGNVAAGIGKGIHAVGSNVEQGLTPQHNQDTPAQTPDPHTSSTEPEPIPPTLLGTLSSGASALLAPVRDTADAGLSIGSKVARSGLDVATGTASLAHNATDAGVLIGTKAVHSGLSVGSEVARSGLDVANDTASLVHNATDAGVSISTKVVHSGLSIGSEVARSGLDVATGTASLVHNATDVGVSISTKVAQSGLSIGSEVARAGLDLGVDVATGTASLIRNATDAGVSIGIKVAQSGLDMSADVVAGTSSLAGTALGGIVAAAAETTSTVFEPVGAGIKTLEGLNQLGMHGVEAINGLSVAAVRKVSELTREALNMDGKVHIPYFVCPVTECDHQPTFFDPDADGIVHIRDTVRGLVLLGLNKKIAKCAAYTLHLAFSYSTSESWLPSLDRTLPIHVSKMTNTRWGKNWGDFERINWVVDVEIYKVRSTRYTNRLTN